MRAGSARPARARRISTRDPEDRRTTSRTATPPSRRGTSSIWRGCSRTRAAFPPTATSARSGTRAAGSTSRIQSTASLAAMGLYEKVSDLSIEVEGYSLDANDREYGSFTRGSTIVRLQGGGEEGLGEDVAYEVLDHVAHRDAGPIHHLSEPSTLGDLCELIGTLDLFTGAPPEREVSRHYRRWAYESSALDLALRQNGLTLHKAVGRDPKPLTFVCSTRLSAFDDETPSSTDAISRRLAKYPSLEFKLDPENDWTD